MSGLQRMLGIFEFRDIPPDQIRRIVAKLAYRRGHELDNAGAVIAEDNVVYAVGQESIPGLAVSKGDVGQLQVGDVLDSAADAQDRAGPGPAARSMDDDVADFAIGPHQPGLEIIVDPFAQGALDADGQLLGVFRSVDGQQILEIRWRRGRIEAVNPVALLGPHGPIGLGVPGKGPDLGHLFG